MPFKAQIFQENVDQLVPDVTRDKLMQICQSYGELTTPQQKALCIQGMMDILDREVDIKTRCTIMEACGRSCIGTSILEKARRLQKKAIDLDDLLSQLNQAHIGGGHLQRDKEVIYASYEQCYCGSVSKTRKPLSSTYCHCSCGWFRELFASLLNRPVVVELLASIIQGDGSCQFVIRIQ
jgi:predicted hydrocarbon binding protein